MWLQKPGYIHHVESLADGFKLMLNTVFLLSVLIFQVFQIFISHFFIGKACSAEKLFLSGAGKVFAENFT